MLRPPAAQEQGQRRRVQGSGHRARSADVQSKGLKWWCCALQRPRSGDSDGEGETAVGNAKKARVVWSVEMHQQFVNAVNTLGVDSAPLFFTGFQ